MGHGEVSAFCQSRDMAEDWSCAVADFAASFERFDRGEEALLALHEMLARVPVSVTRVALGRARGSACDDLNASRGPCGARGPA